MEAYDERENDRRTSRQNPGAVRDGLGVNTDYRVHTLYRNTPGTLFWTWPHALTCAT